jgi:hypothetical protein
MAVLSYLVGAMLIAVGLTDIFLTVLHYDEPGLIAARSYRLAWRFLRRATTHLAPDPRAVARSMVAPLMVVGSVAGWLGTQVLGFALVFLPAISDRREFAFGTMPRGFVSSLYFSAANLTSLSFSDAEPKTLLFHCVSALETIVGLAILTLSISYLLGLYQVLQSQSVLAARLQHQSQGENDPRALLAPHFVGGEPKGVSTLLRDLHQNLTDHYEGMRRYPIVYYFHTREPQRSIPYIFWFIGASAAALRWGLPDGHEASTDPWLPALLDGFDDVRRRVTRRFLAGTPEPPMEPLSFERFKQAHECGGAVGTDADDERLTTFIELEGVMRRLAALDGSSDPTEAYSRYRDWVGYTSRGRAFVEAASRDLGLDPAELYQPSVHEGAIG